VRQAYRVFVVHTTTPVAQAVLEPSIEALLKVQELAGNTSLNPRCPSDVTNARNVNCDERTGCQLGSSRA
jgi:hypothetical protein